jgi:hypothetical protein
MVPFSFLPKVYASGRVVVDEKRTVGLFMGDWFEAYAEFHISKPDEASPSRLKVWDPGRTPYELSDAQAAAIYQKAAEILTAYYAVDTFEQIFSWHHAAGDFVVKLDGDRIRLKLVTVRRYEQMMRSNAKDAGTVIQALLIFLINMTLRMRIDRLDGVGELMWLDPYVVSASLRGFFKGIEAKERFNSLPKGFAESFKAYLSRISRSECVRLVRAIAERLPSESSERTLAMVHAETHAKEIYAALRRI